MSTYETKSDWKKTALIDTSDFDETVDLATLKLDSDELENNPIESH